MTTTPHAGQCEIETVELYPSGGGNPVDLTGSTLGIDIYESIFSSAVSGTILIGNTDGIVSNLPILGQEFLKIKISTPTANGNKTIDFTKSPLIVYKIASETPIGNDGRAILLKFVSPELLRNFRIRISKSFIDTPSNIIKTLITNKLNINSNKKLHLEKTNSARKIICPNIHPFQFVKHLVRESRSQSTGAPHYLFFENCDGYHFRSLQSLYDGGIIRKLHNGEEGTFEGNEQGQKMNHEFGRLLNYNIEKRDDMLQNTTTGMLGSKLVTHDIFNKRYETTFFGYFNDFNKFTNSRINRDSSDSPVYNDGSIDEFGNNVGSFVDSKMHLHPTSNTGEDFSKDAQHYLTTSVDDFSIYNPNNANMWLLDRQSRFVQIKNSISISAEIYGDTNMRAGDLVSVVLENPHSNDDIDRSTTGKYLLSSLRHNFIQSGNSAPMHRIFMRGVRDSRPESPKGGSSVEPKMRSKRKPIEITS